MRVDWTTIGRFLTRLGYLGSRFLHPTLSISRAIQTEIRTKLDKIFPTLRVFLLFHYLRFVSSEEPLRPVRAAQFGGHWHAIPQPVKKMSSMHQCLQLKGIFSCHKFEWAV